MLTKQQLIETCDFTHQYLDETFSKSKQDWIKNFPRAAQHRWQHTLNVLQNAEKILDGEKLDQDVVDVVKISAVMHDISVFVCDHTVHGQVSAEIAEQYLKDQGFSNDFTKRVAQAIAEHGVDFDTLSPEEMGARFSLEGKILIEADLLDKFGASAVTNALLTLGEKGLLPFECHAALNEGVPLQRAKYFKDYVWTETGRKMRDNRFGFFLAYLDQLSEEVAEKTSPF
jgi:HD superfamily phosphodiesterase